MNYKIVAIVLIILILIGIGVYFILPKEKQTKTPEIKQQDENVNIEFSKEVKEMLKERNRKLQTKIVYGKCLTTNKKAYENVFVSIDGVKMLKPKDMEFKGKSWQNTNCKIEINYFKGDKESFIWHKIYDANILEAKKEKANNGIVYCYNNNYFFFKEDLQVHLEGDCLEQFNAIITTIH